MVNIFRKLFPPKLKNTGLNPMVLLVLDGWGVAPPSAGNPMASAKTPNMDAIRATYPHTELIASGEDVGLPAGEVGNTEVGHLNMGAGRVILQELKRINLAIEKGFFVDNQAFVQAVNHVRNNKSKLHIMGLFSSGRVHSSIDHFNALIAFCKKSGLSNEVFCHVFTDGRDAPPKEGAEMVVKVEETLKTAKVGRIASVMGRYYAMDRDRRWDRTKKAYDALTQGIGKQATSVKAAIEAAYANALLDEFIEPTMVVGADGKPVATIDDNDAVIFFNFRIDRPRQLTMAFVADDFKKVAGTWGFDPYNIKYQKTHGAGDGKDGLEYTDPFVRGKVVKNLFFVTMTEYQSGLPVSAIAYAPEKVEKCLAQVLSEEGLKQMHMSESEKERFVTYYFDGLREERFEGESVVIVPSPKVPTYDRKPEMSVFNLVDRFKEELSKGIYSFFVINFANPDMVAHTGNIQATIKALEATDKALGMMMEAVLAVGGTLVITADHGNAEELLSYDTTTFFYTTTKGEVNTDHSSNPVLLAVVGAKYQNQEAKEILKGSLNDIAPTILKIMGIEKPIEMTGKVLLE